MASPDKIYKEAIDVFYGGVSDDVRIQKKEVFESAQQFDIFTNPKALTPYRQMKADENTAFKIAGFGYEQSTLLGVGRKSGVTNIKIYQKTTGSSISSSWAAVTNGEAGETNGSAVVCAICYHNYLFGNRQSGSGLWAWGEIAGTPLFTDAAYAAIGSVQAQGIITSDDLLIVPGTNELAVKDGGSTPTSNWSKPLTLPSNRLIRDLCEYGEFVAIATRPGSGYNSQIGSKVYLWDKVSPDPSHTIDWGEGHLLILDDLEGVLIGISQVGLSTEEGNIKQKLVVREYTGGDDARVIFEIEADAGSNANLSVLPNITKVKDGNRLLFGLKIVRNGVTYYQMACVGRKSAAYPWAFTLDRLVDNSVAVTSIEAAFKLGQTFFIAHNADGSVNRTDDTEAYTDATYVSQRLNGSGTVDDAARRKKVLVMGGLKTAPLTSGQSASLYFRADGTTTWKLVRTYTYGDDAAASPAVVPGNMGFESSKFSDDTDFFNYFEGQFKAVASGGAQITNLIYAWKFAGADVVSE